MTLHLEILQINIYGACAGLCLVSRARRILRGPAARAGKNTSSLPLRTSACETRLFPIVEYKIAIEIWGGSFKESYCHQGLIVTYRMKPPNIKALKCTSFSIQCFIFQGQRSQGHTSLATAPCEHRFASLLWRAHFESLRAAEAKNVATINQLKYRTSALRKI